MFKDLFGTKKNAKRSWFTYISKQQSDFATSRGYLVYAKFLENETLTKMSEFTVWNMTQIFAVTTRKTQ